MQITRSVQAGQQLYYWLSWAGAGAVVDADTGQSTVFGDESTRHDV
jgi:hypothetical protein